MKNNKISSVARDKNSVEQKRHGFISLDSRSFNLGSNESLEVQLVFDKSLPDGSQG